MPLFLARASFEPTALSWLRAAVSAGVGGLTFHSSPAVAIAGACLHQASSQSTPTPTPTAPQPLIHQQPWSFLVPPSLALLGLHGFSSQAQAQAVAQRGSRKSASPISPPRQPWKVRVVTGNVRGAGSPHAAYLQLVGSRGASDRFLLGETEADQFVRGTSRTFTLPIDQDIGSIRRVHVEQRRDEDRHAGDGWYLQEIEVISPTGEHLIFPCNAWLGEDERGKAPTEYDLGPLASAETEQYQRPVRVHASGVAIPHPAKVADNGIKGVNRKGRGYAGEDAYFYCEGRCVCWAGLPPCVPALTDCDALGPGRA